MDRAGRNPRLSSPGPADRAGKLPALKDAHEARLTAHAALGEALLKIHSGNADAAGKTAAWLLRRVRAPEFDLTGLSPAEANCVKRMPAEAWMAIAQCFAGPPETPPAPREKAPPIDSRFLFVDIAAMLRAV